MERVAQMLLITIFIGTVSVIVFPFMLHIVGSPNEKHTATVWHREVTCRETQMRNFCYCAGDNSCSFTEKCDVAEKAGFDVIYYGKDVFK